MDTSAKIIDVKTLKVKLKKHHLKKEKIAFTNGCFDILHYGHISYLEKAKGRGRILVVGVNSDASVRRIKGAKRPIISQKERTRVLAALACIDYVVIFNEPTPLELIKAVRPDILIKGADWKKEDIVGYDVVSAYGGRVERINYLKNYSTTRIIETIKLKCGA